MIHKFKELLKLFFIFLFYSIAFAIAIITINNIDQSNIQIKASLIYNVSVLSLIGLIVFCILLCSSILILSTVTESDKEGAINDNKTYQCYACLILISYLNLPAYILSFINWITLFDTMIGQTYLIWNIIACVYPIIYFMIIIVTTPETPIMKPKIPIQINKV